MESHPHMLCVGSTGSGKTYALSLILGKICKYHYPEAQITICDYKKSGFAQYFDCQNSFFGYEDVTNGIRSVYEEFTKRLEANDDKLNKQMRVLLMDEYGAFIASREKKQADEIKTMVGNMLLMGRSLGIRIIVGIQRADAEFFKSGTREQFGAILALGNMSKEQKLMLFPDYREEMTDNCGRGQGYLLLDGQGIRHIAVPTVTKPDALEATIRSAMNRRIPIPPAPAGEA